MEINTEHLRIIPPALKNADFLQSGTDIMIQLRELFTAEAGHRPGLELPDYIWFTNWEIVLKRNSSQIGNICFMGAPHNGNVELNYGMNPIYRGLGYITEAIIALTAWAFRQPTVQRVMVGLEPWNLTTQEALHQAGFVKDRETADSSYWVAEKNIFSES